MTSSMSKVNDGSCSSRESILELGCKTLGLVVILTGTAYLGYKAIENINSANNKLAKALIENEKMKKQIGVLSQTAKNHEKSLTCLEFRLNKLKIPPSPKKLLLSETIYNDHETDENIEILEKKNGTSQKRKKTHNQSGNSSFLQEALSGAGREFGKQAAQKAINITSQNSAGVLTALNLAYRILGEKKI